MPGLPRAFARAYSTNGTERVANPVPSLEVHKAGSEGSAEADGPEHSSQAKPNVKVLWPKGRLTPLSGARTPATTRAMSLAVCFDRLCRCSVVCNFHLRIAPRRQCEILSRRLNRDDTAFKFCTNLRAAVQHASPAVRNTPEVLVYARSRPSAHGHRVYNRAPAPPAHPRASGPFMQSAPDCSLSGPIFVKGHLRSTHTTAVSDGGISISPGHMATKMESTIARSDY
jgi:hypothetical protein